MAPSRYTSFVTVLLSCFLLFLGGCFPFACQPTESRALFAADSLSRSFAETIPVDTLETLWESQGDIETKLVYPRTVRFGPDSTLFVSDVEAHQILEFRDDGTLHRVHSSISYDAPYIIGVQPDTILILNPTARRIDYTTPSGSNELFKIPEDYMGQQVLQYATASDSTIYYKAIAENQGGYIASHSLDGRVLQKTLLPDPYWRYAGMLRTWGDTLISMSAYKPMVDLVHTNGRLDSLVLYGFDSPMLSRSRAFTMGNIAQPPLLYSSAAPAGDLLFILNLRPGWLRVDVFGRNGTLTHRLVQTSPGFNKDFYPIDIDARMTPAGAYELAIAYLEPEPKVTLYNWHPGE